MMLILSVKNLFIVLLFVLISSISIPQNNRKTDSNATLFSQCDDSTKIILYKELAWSLRNKEPLESIKYGTEALQLSELLKDSNQLASVYNYLGVFRNKMSKYAEALIYYYKALKIAVLIDNKTETGYAYNNIGEIYALQNNDSLAAINFQKALSSFQEVNNS